MAMKCHWRSSPFSRATIKDSSSTLSPLTVRNRYQNVVPQGTVASRVHFLQGLEYPHATRTPDSDTNQQHGDSRTGFGRRLKTRFGSPASRKTVPIDESEIEIAHSFLGLSTPRKNHDEVHAKSNRRSTNNQKKSLAGQIKRQGMPEMIPYDTLPPGSTVPKSPPATSSRRVDNTPQMGALREISPSVNKKHFPTKTAVSVTEADYRQDMTRRPKSQPGTLNSEASFATASTVRRQSVRELFRDYGIERPAGLASSKDTSRETDETPRPARSYTYCHVCSWVNNYSVTNCWRCKHGLGEECDALSLTRKVTNLDSESRYPSEQQVWTSIPRPNENRIPTQCRIKQKPIRPSPTPIQIPEEERTAKRRQSNPPAKFPSFSLDKSVMQKKMIFGPPELPIIPEQPKVVPVLSGSQVTTSVKDSPFLLADILSGNHSLRLFSKNTQTSRLHSRRIKGRLRNNSSSCFSPDGNCDSPGCRATHNGHEPYRHSVACSEKNSRANQETYIGCLAGTSRVEDADVAPPSCHTYFSRPHSRSSRYSNPPSFQPPNSRPASGLACREANASNEYQLPEYVECYGYPRTGHAHHGSPISTGIVGECQHCLDDCQCLACQDTHHSVRCCVHKDHHAIVHHHHTPRMVAKVAKPSIDLLEQSEPHRVTHLPPSQPRTVVPLKTDDRASSLPALMKSPVLTTPRLNPSKEAEPEKNPNLLRSKRSTRSTFIKEVPEPPTPPPWVSLPKMRSISAATVPGAKSKQTMVTSNFTEFPFANQDHLFKEMPVLLPPATCKRSNLERREILDEETWRNIWSDHEIKHDHHRRESCTLPSQTTTVTTEQHTRSASSGAPAQVKMALPTPKHQNKLNTFFKMQEENTKLVEEPPLVEQACYIGLEAIEQSRARLRQFESFEKETNDKDNAPSTANLKNVPEKKSKWKMQLADTELRPARSNDKVKTVQEQTLSDDEAVDKIIDGNEVVSVSGIRVRNLDPKAEEQQCVWKSRVLDERNKNRVQEAGDDPDIQGITVVIHILDREDIVFKIDAWEGGELRRD